jgi:hypothetical protein
MRDIAGWTLGSVRPHHPSTTGSSVTIPGEGTFTYGEGTVPDLVAEAYAGHLFDEWTGDVSTIADVNAAIAMNGYYAITVNFVKQQCNCG